MSKRAPRARRELAALKAVWVDMARALAAERGLETEAGRRGLLL